MSFSQHLLMQWVALLSLGVRVVEAQTQTRHVEINIPLIPFILLIVLLCWCCCCRPRDNDRGHQGSSPMTITTTALPKTATAPDWMLDSTANMKEDNDHSERASTGSSSGSSVTLKAERETAAFHVGRDRTLKSLEPADVEAGLTPTRSADTNDEVQA